MPDFTHHMTSSALPSTHSVCLRYTPGNLPPEGASWFGSIARNIPYTIPNRDPVIRSPSPASLGSLKTLLF